MANCRALGAVCVMLGCSDGEVASDRENGRERTYGGATHVADSNRTAGGVRSAATPSPGVNPSSFGGSVTVAGNTAGSTNTVNIGGTAGVGSTNTVNVGGTAGVGSTNTVNVGGAAGVGSTNTVNVGGTAGVGSTALTGFGGMNNVRAAPDVLGTPAGPVPSRQSVTFRISSERSDSVFLTRSVVGCENMQIEVLRGDEWAKLPLEVNQSIPMSCHCPRTACDFAPSMTVMDLQGANRIVDLTWDARALSTWQEIWHCTWSYVMDPVFERGALQPVPAGHYRVTLPFNAPLPSTCSSLPTEGYRCSGSMVGGLHGAVRRCPSTDSVSTEFDLPASGDIVVPVTIPALQ